MSKVKECPFCGMHVMMICNRGGVLPFAVECGRLECNAMTKYFPTEEQAIEAWNTRKPMNRIVERLEELKAFEDVWDDEMSCGAYNAYHHAIEIVKEEGGINEFNES